ncbi:MAG: gamma carbonic anhydrase family protein [Crocinitomicaceae bacterium]|nr:gamma carbonic anhydrase family protein [Crocinitomicaceae bacterium]|tara:strand:- start:1755 stop:2351 length:597 start_codon:yes stop_codon:yes gene_type:complete
MIMSFKGMIPVIHPSSYIHPTAVVIGHVTIGKDCYIGPSAVLRGDWGKVIIGDGCNVQESCTLHMFPGKSVVLKDGAHVGHGAVIHGAELGEQVLVGMNSVVMDDVVLGDGSFVGALSLVPANKVFEPKSLIVGNPARRVKEVSDEMYNHKVEGTELYRQLPSNMYEISEEVEPLTEVPDNRVEDFPKFDTWMKRKEV